MELHYIPVSTYSQKAVIAFYEKGVEFEPRLVDMTDPQARAAYRKIYPIGKVPLLIPEPGYLVPESSIIVEYLENHFPDRGTKLIPHDPHAARKVRFLDRMNDLYLLDHTAFLFFQSMKPEEQRDSERIAEARRHIGIVLDHLEDRLAGNTWLAGEDFTMADCSALPALGLANVSHPYGDYPNVTAYFERGAQRPSVKKIFDQAAPMLERFMARAE